ncbi:phage tail protein [Pseudomonas glycinae]|uniref:phage tail-collar fiber domain-containing protein n=1 Tax=Pseudomonas glycinae TaxID=1785145 RepID=UPI001C8921E1|nr:phage tail protein [Pseudomonas glycinae]MBX8625803.1 phage tail protein [Pseudomonas glycinae]
MSASITLAGEGQIALKQSQKKPLIISKFIFANVPGLKPETPVNRAAGKPPAGQIVHVYDIPEENRGFVNPNQIVYSAQIGSDIGDWDFNYVGLEDADGLLFAVSYVPLQQKRRNIPPLQIGNNVTRNFLVAFDGAMQLTGVKIDASTWQHDFTVRLAGIDERERLSNRNLYGRAFFFSNSLIFEKVDSGYQINGGTAFVEGIRVAIAKSEAVTGVIPVGKIWLDVWLERRLNDRVAAWKVVFGEQADYTDAAGVRHYCVPLADFISSSNIVDLRDAEPVGGALVKYFASRTGDYPLLRARGTTKEDVKLGNLPNAKSDDPATNSSEVLATTAALNKSQQQMAETMTGMVSPFAMFAAPVGWLKCNGAAVSRTTYKNLYARINTYYGEGDGTTTFNLPDLRGLFLRGYDDGRGLDPNRAFGVFQDMMIHSHAHTASATAVGDHIHAAWTDAQGLHAHRAWTDVQGAHSHSAPGSPGIGQGSGGVNSVQQAGGAHETSLAGAHQHGVGMDGAGSHAHNVGVGAGGAHTHGVTVAAAGGTETRPKNMALLFCIKY